MLSRGVETAWLNTTSSLSQRNKPSESQCRARLFSVCMIYVCLVHSFGRYCPIYNALKADTVCHPYKNQETCCAHNTQPPIKDPKTGKCRSFRTTATVRYRRLPRFRTAVHTAVATVSQQSTAKSLEIRTGQIKSNQLCMYKKKDFTGLWSTAKSNCMPASVGSSAEQAACKATNTKTGVKHERFHASPTF